MKRIIKKKIVSMLTWAGLTCSLLSSALVSAATVDLLVLYDTYSKNYFSGDPQTAMVSWVNQMNATYRDSQVDIQIRLVGVRPNENAGTTMNAVLSSIRTNAGIIALRDQLGADFVSQLHQTGSCGLGYVSVSKSYAFNVVGPNCGPLTMVHELGHNMGLNHSRRQGDTGGSRYGYGLGYGVDNQFATVMAYGSSFNASRMARFSNPTIQCKGLPCGVPVGQSEEAYAALALQNVRDEIAAFNPTKGGAAAVATVAQHCNYGGYSIGLPVGKYTTSQLAALGIKENDVSSIRVQAGYTAILYENDNFTGNSITRTTDDTCFVSAGFNDVASSIVVAPTTTTSFDLLLQAESYASNLGVKTETTTDIGGGLNVGWIDANDWMAFNNITFPTTGNYTIEYRVASLSGGGLLSLDLNAGTIPLGDVSISSTGGWQNWVTVTQNVTITAGTYNLGVFAKKGGWNLNWIRIKR